MNKETWINNKWRPAMGWVYMAICIFDFIVFPIGWTLAQYYFGGAVATAWAPITLSNGGLFHLAMGAIVGVTAWSRGQEKINRVAGPLGSYESIENETVEQTPYE